MTMHPHEREEIEAQSGPRLWDATPGVCCAAFQLGACPHTEAFDPEDMSDAELAELRAAEVSRPPAQDPYDDAPF